MKKRMTAPANWESLFNVVKMARKCVEAPVDVIGCDRLYKPTDTPEDIRYQKLVSLMLSAQTRDEKTFEAMQNLNAWGCSVKKISKTPEAKVKEMIHCVSFFNNKANYIKRTTDLIAKDHAGIVPSDYSTLMKMPGLGPKMIHLFLQCADGKVEGIGVDVHMHRIAQRWKWVPSTVKDPEGTRKGLEDWLPKKHWDEVNEILVGWGQTVCTPRNPDCLNCPARGICVNAFKEESEKQKRERMLSGKSIASLKAEVAKPPTTMKEVQALCKNVVYLTKDMKKGTGRAASVTASKQRERSESADPEADRLANKRKRK